MRNPDQLGRGVRTERGQPATPIDIQDGTWTFVACGQIGRYLKIREPFLVLAVGTGAIRETIAKMPKLTIAVSPATFSIISDKISTGKFSSASEVVAAALAGSADSENIYGHILDCVEDPIVYINDRWQICYLNSAAETFFGICFTEVCGKPLFEACRQLRGSPFEVAIRDTMSERNPRETIGPSPAHPHSVFQASTFRLSVGVGIIFRDVTHKKQPATAIRLDGERLRLALEASALGDWSWDCSSDLVTLSEKAANVFELSPGSHTTSKAIIDLIHPDDVQLARNAATKCIKARVPYQIDCRIRSQHLGWRWISASGAATDDGSGRVLGMIGVVQDITERKKADEDREITAERLTRAHRAARAAAWEWDLVSNEIFWTDPHQAQSLVGAQLPLPNPTRLSDWLNLIHPDDQQRHGEEAAQVLHDGEGRVEFRIVVPDSGQVRWLEATGQVVNRSEEGHPQCLRGITLDITSRKEAEIRLRQSEEQFKTITDRIPNFVWFSDAHGNIDYINQRWQDFTGQTSEDALGTGWAAMVHPDDVEQALHRWHAAVAQGATYEAELRYRCHTGTYRWYVARAEPLRDSVGTVTGWFGASTDIHDTRQAEQESRAETEALEILNRTGAAIAAEIDLERLVQTVTDAGVELTGAQFGAFFYAAQSETGEILNLYTISGVPREHFSRFPMPRNTHVFDPTFRGEAIVRSDDITQDPRYGKNDPYWGMPKGHLPVRSYLALPVKSRGGEVIGGLFFGHPEPGVFTARTERLMTGIAAQAAIAIDKAQLFRAAQHEIAERKRKEVALRESEEFSRSVVQSSGDCIKVLGLDGTLQFMNENGRCLMEVDDFNSIEGCSWAGLWPSENAADVRAAIQAATSGGVGRFSAFCPTAKGTPKWWDVVVTPVLGADGNPVRLVSISRDVTEQRRAEDARQLLLRELNHRVKNLFAIASGMVTMTARTATNVDDMSKALKGRLGALARAHELIRSAITADAEHQENTVLRSLLAEVLRPHHSEHGDQLSLQGPEVQLGVSASTSLALIFHELATNAAKYGALSCPAGMLRIMWQVADNVLELKWMEQVPGIALHPPIRHGFGSKLAYSSVERQLGGSIHYEWLASGVQIRLNLPIDQLRR